MPARHHPSTPPKKTPKDTRDAKAPVDSKGPVNSKAPVDSKGPTDSGDSKDRTDSGEPKNAKNAKGSKGPRSAKPPKNAGPAEPAMPAGRTHAIGQGEAAEGNAAVAATAVGRIPVLDVRPLVQQGRRPAKAVVGETFEVSATVFREGHDAVAANVVLRDPDGEPGPWTPMRELAPGTDRWGADVTPDATGRWTYTVEAWGDPVSTWRHHAGVKVPAGMDTESVLEEGARLYERAADGVPNGPERKAVLIAVEALRDESRPPVSRLAAALTPEVDAVLARFPLRELVTASEPLPLLV
ncbi:maltotransferase domain-containing protein, partial [Streptomyces sp. NPDC012616]|uniref:maltotransferase domain-containing protein n=1 Tax=Streptomyces sp. NPDC012616 TaxID=3364840 RepID=UPI0036EFEBC8